MPLDRRQFVLIAASPLARLLAAPPSSVEGQAPAPAQPVAPPITPEFFSVRRNVICFTARGGTIGCLINKDGVLVVDTQYADTAKTCLAGLKERAGGRGIDLVFNTHHHADHTGGNGVFKAETKKIVAHAKVPDLMKMVAASAPPTAATPVFPDATFDKTWSEKIGDERVTAAYNGPGHTSGDAIIHFEQAHVVHMGDLLFHMVHPRVDRAAGASIQNWIAILENVAKMFPADTMFIAGHAKDNIAVVKRPSVQHFRDYLTAVLSFTQREIAKGQSKETIAATATLPGFDDVQALGVLTLKGVLENAFDELTSRPR